LGKYSCCGSTIPSCHPSGSGLFQRYRAGLARKAHSARLGAAGSGQGRRGRQSCARRSCRSARRYGGAGGWYLRRGGKAAAAREQDCQSDSGQGEASAAALCQPVPQAPTHWCLRAGRVRGQDGVRFHVQIIGGARDAFPSHFQRVRHDTRLCGAARRTTRGGNTYRQSRRPIPAGPRSLGYG
jgi:hypothetical protein